MKKRTVWEKDVCVVSSFASIDHFIDFFLTRSVNVMFCIDSVAKILAHLN